MTTPDPADVHTGTDRVELTEDGSKATNQVPVPRTREGKP